MKGDCSVKLVRNQRRVSRKRYLNSKRTYEYERMSVHVPRSYHEIIKPLLKQDFDMNVTVENGTLVITLSPAKTFRHAASLPQKQ